MINVNDYNRPGIFFEERNDSTVPAVPVQEAIINFVPGFSRKGVFNRAILLASTQDREAVFGPIDRSLEKKGSFFHRTIDTALRSGPVWGLNLLSTTEDDVLEYVSLSLAPQFDNAAAATEEYATFFDRSGFWKRSTDNLIDIADSDDKILHVTNMGDRKITIFMYKDKLTGFDVTAESWYGSRDKVPTWMYSTDLISDYMVRFVVLAGDWSNYAELSIDPTWSTYFTANGLDKTKVTRFFAERNVNVLLNEVVSLIPYFRDRNGRNLFIETVVNAKTDITGAYVAFDIDALETDLPNGLVDLMGHTLVYLRNRPTDPEEKQTVTFASYDDTIVETDDYDETVLDRLGNVVGVGSVSARSSVYTPGNLSGLVINASVLDASTSAAPVATVTSSSGYAVFSGAQVDVDTQSVTLSTLSRSSTVGESNYKITILYLDSTGVLNKLESTVVSYTSGESDPDNVTGLTFPSSYPNSALVLGYVYSEARQHTGVDITNDYFTVSLDGSGFVPLTIGTSSTDIVYDNTVDADTWDITFTSTANVTKADPLAWRRKQFFDALVAAKTTESVVVDASGVKRAVSTGTWSDNSSVTSADKNITLTISGSTIKTQLANGDLILYSSDDEFQIGTTTMTTKNTEATTTDGVVAKYSEFYEDFVNGFVKTGDYFYVKHANLTDVRFGVVSGVSYFIVPTSQVIAAMEDGYQMWIQGHTVNNGLFTLADDGATSVTGLTLSSETAFELVEDVTAEDDGESVELFSYADKVYLRLYTASDVLNVKFYSDRSLSAAYVIGGSYLAINTALDVCSDEGAYAQTVEIEEPTGYTLTDNKFLVLASRYPEIVVGDFIEAYVDYDEVEAGEVPKSFTRILSKRPWATDSDYMEITTDAKISVSTFEGDLQTTRYTYFDKYADTYKAIVLNGFTVRAASVPDGTETRQDSILDVMGTATSLYRAVTDKENFSFRYLVDSFGLGLTEFSKQQYADICGERLNCIGFINMPSVKSFKNSTSPSFVDDEGVLSAEFIRLGGDPESNPAFLYSFAEGDGRTAVGYFTPYVTINDNDRPLSMPPAAFVANTYMAKNTSKRSGVYRWTIAAGTEDGRVTGIAALEHNYTNDDIVELDQMGANAIRYSRNKGFYLETEYTADRDPESSLSYMHSREVLIELENEMYGMLLPYHWKFNTAAIRAEIKRKADGICQRFVDRSALYAYRNVIDETNNTDELIDSQVGLLETYVEIIKGMGVIVNVINVVRKGGIASGLSSGFTDTGITSLA